MEPSQQATLVRAVFKVKVASEADVHRVSVELQPDILLPPHLRFTAPASLTTLTAFLCRLQRAHPQTRITLAKSGPPHFRSRAT